MAKRLSPYEEMKANGEKILRLASKKGLSKAQREERELVEGLTKTLEESAYGSDLKAMVNGVEPRSRPDGRPSSQADTLPADRPDDQVPARATSQPSSQPDYQASSQPYCQPLDQPKSRPGTIHLKPSPPVFNPALGSHDPATSAHYAYIGLSVSQRSVLHYLIANWQPIISYPQMERDLDIRYDTIRNAVKRLKKLGFLTHRQARVGQIQGVNFTLNQMMLQSVLHDAPGPDQSLDRSLDQPASQPTNLATDRPADPPASPPPLLDRQKENNLSVKESSEAKLLALSDEDIAFFWPALSKAGFGRDQVRQILIRLEQVNRSTDKLFVSLDYADWELANGEMKDKNGQVIKNPPGYLFNSLARTGYYRRPSGYVSPEEQAALDQEQEARQVREAKARADEQAFMTWKESLSKEELDAILKGRIGPEEQWLRSRWNKEKGDAGS